MDITDVRVKLASREGDRLKAYCTIVLDGEFVVRDVRIVDGTNGLFVAMPSRKLTIPCEKCGFKNPLLARFCNVTALPMAWSGWALLVSAGTEVPTSKVYAAHRWVKERAETSPNLRQITSATSADHVMSLTRNDLEQAVFGVEPEVMRAFTELHHHGHGPFRVSGAGSTLYRLFDQEEDANRVAEEVTQAGIGTWAKVVAAPVGQQPIVTEES